MTCTWIFTAASGSKRLETTQMLIADCKWDSPLHRHERLLW